jgi:hypothetical protein
MFCLGNFKNSSDFFCFSVFRFFFVVLRYFLRAGCLNRQTAAHLDGRPAGWYLFNHVYYFIMFCYFILPFALIPFLSGDMMVGCLLQLSHIVPCIMLYCVYDNRRRVKAKYGIDGGICSSFFFSLLWPLFYVL